MTESDRHRKLANAVVAFYLHRKNRDNFGHTAEYLRLYEAEKTAIEEELAARMASEVRSLVSE